MFQLTKEELKNWRPQIVTGSQKHRDPRRPPFAFTEHGVAMLASVVRSDRAVQMSIFIVRAFIQLRELLVGNKELARRIEQLETAQKQLARTQQQHGAILVTLVQDVQKLKAPPVTRAIGFITQRPQEESTLTQYYSVCAALARSV